MLNVSNAFKEQLFNDNRDYLLYANMVLADGKNLPVTNKQLWEGGFKVDAAVSSDSSFDIGAAIIGKLTITLNNIYDEFSPYDFEDAVVTAQVGLLLENGKEEKVQKGVYTVDDPQYNGSIITLSCLDNMHKFERSYSKSKLTYPATVGAIIRDACDCCGVSLLTTAFDGSTQIVKARPPDEALTFLQVISWCAQRCCKFARCDEYGRLVIGWYDTAAYEQMGGLKGGWFDSDTPYSSGDSAHGGTFNPWSTGSTIAPEDFSAMRKYHHIYATSSLSVCTDDVVITGVKVTARNEDDEDVFHQFGKDGYVIGIEGNELISASEVRTVAEFIGSRLVGLRFRPFSCMSLNDPTIEPGDICYVTDGKQNSYRSFVTGTVFQSGNYQSLRCSAETPSRNRAAGYSAATKAIVEARKNAEKQISKYDQVVQQMTHLISQGFGMYLTPIEQSDGSTIWYLHDKPTIKESSYVCYHTSNGIMASTNGGTSWAIDKNGNALVNVLTAIGVQAEWIDTRGFTAKDNNGNITFQINEATGAVTIAATSFSLSGKTIAQLVDVGITEFDKSLTQQEIFDKLTNKGQQQGIYLQNGKLYLNFSYAKGGTLTLGGNGNGNGRLVIVDAANAQVGYIDNTGAHFNKGTFSGSVTASTMQGCHMSAGDIDGTVLKGTEIYSGSFSTIAKDKKEKRDSVRITNGMIDFGDGQKIYSQDEEIYEKVIDAVNGKEELLPAGIFIEGDPVSPYETLELRAHKRMDILVGSSRWLTATSLPTGHVNEYFTKSGTPIYRGFNFFVDVTAKNLYSRGTKNRIVETEHYGERLQYCYETPSPMFGDIGSGRTDDNGVCYISLDDVFAETVDDLGEYFVFLQKEGAGDLWVDVKEPEYFIVKGTPNLSFSWELKAAQRGFEMNRSEDFALKPDNEISDGEDLEEIFERAINDYDREMEELANEDFESVSGH